MPTTARFHVVHSGLSVMKNNCLYSHLESDLAMLRALSPLAILIQQTISKLWPDLYNMLKRTVHWGIGGSIFQTVARNFDTTVLHRDPLDKTIAWLYYEGSWENSSFLIPELKISAKLGSGTLIGVWGCYLFHGSSKNTGQGTCYVFYNNFLQSKHVPILTKLTKQIHEEITWTW